MTNLNFWDLNVSGRLYVPGGTNQRKFGNETVPRLCRWCSKKLGTKPKTSSVIPKQDISN